MECSTLLTSKQLTEQEENLEGSVSFSSSWAMSGKEGDPHNEMPIKEKQTHTQMQWERYPEVSLSLSGFNLESLTVWLFKHLLDKQTLWDF